MAMDKKHILFVVVLILLVVSIVYRAYNPFEQTRVETLTFTGEQHLSTHSISLEENPTHVHDTVSRFMDPPLVSASVHQDLFSIYQPPRPAPALKASPKSPLDDTPLKIRNRTAVTGFKMPSERYPDTGFSEYLKMKTKSLSSWPKTSRSLSLERETFWKKNIESMK
jgi:hypothetical protein